MIYSTVTGGGYDYDFGTSMATPHVSGIASLMRGYKPNLVNDDIENIIKLSADKVGSDPYVNGWNDKMGYGRVNAKKALDRLNSNLYTLTHTYAVGGTSHGTSSSIYPLRIFGAQGLEDKVYYVKRHEVRKNISYQSTTVTSVWGRGVGTRGWAHEPPVSGNYYNFSYGWCEPVPGTVTSTGATLRTYVYEVYACPVVPGCEFFGWYPSTPANVRYEYTIHALKIPPAPTLSLDVTGGNPNLNWNAVAGADLYKIYRGTVQGPPGTVNCSMVSQYFNIASTSLTSYIDRETFVDPLSNTLICYYATSVNQAGQSSPSNKVGVHGMADFSIDEIAEAAEVTMPTEFTIRDNYPNPFNPTTTIRYDIPDAARVSLIIYDIMGREIRRLIDGVVEPGYHRAVWDARNDLGVEVSSGVYIYRFTAQPVSDENASAGIHYVRKMIYTK